MVQFKFLFPVILINACVCFSLCVSTQNPVQVTNRFTSRANIQKKREAISRTANIGSKIDMAACGVASALCIGLIYKFIKPTTQNAKIASDKKLGGSIDALKRLLSLENKLLKLESNIKDPDMFGKEWFKMVGKAIVTSIITSGSAGIFLGLFNKFYGRYHCFNNLAEFIGIKFRDMRVLDELLYSAELFYSGSVVYKNTPNEALQEARDRFVVSLKNSVDVVEEIIAFMEYKLGTFDSAKLAQEDVAMPGYLYDCLEKYCANVQLILEGQAGQSNVDEKLFEMTSKFKNSVMSYIEGFVGFETRMIFAAVLAG